MLTVPGDIPLVDRGGDPHAARGASMPRRPSPSCRRTTTGARTRSCARRPTPCRCASATTASSRISPRARARGIEPQIVRCPASHSISTSPKISPCSSSTPSRTRARALARPLGPARRTAPAPRPRVRQYEPSRRTLLDRAAAGETPSRRRGAGAGRVRGPRRADDARPRRSATAGTAASSPIRARCSSR